MELLTILYAFLAAVTGIGGGERVALADRAAIAAPADCGLQVGNARALRVATATQHVRSVRHIVAILHEGPAAALPTAPALFDVASFANRRQ